MNWEETLHPVAGRKGQLSPGRAPGGSKQVSLLKYPRDGPREGGVDWREMLVTGPFKKRVQATSEPVRGKEELESTCQAGMPILRQRSQREASPSQAALGTGGAMLILMLSALGPSCPTAHTGPPPTTSVHRAFGPLGIMGLFLFPQLLCNLCPLPLLSSDCLHLLRGFR